MSPLQSRNRAFAGQCGNCTESGGISGYVNPTQCYTHDKISVILHVMSDNTVTLPKRLVPSLNPDDPPMDVWVINTGTENIRVLPTTCEVVPNSIAWFTHDEDGWRVTEFSDIPVMGCGPVLPY